MCLSTHHCISFQGCKMNCSQLIPSDIWWEAHSFPARLSKDLHTETNNFPHVAAPSRCLINPNLHVFVLVEEAGVKEEWLSACVFSRGRYSRSSWHVHRFLMSHATVPSYMGLELSTFLAWIMKVSLGESLGQWPICTQLESNLSLEN